MASSIRPLPAVGIRSRMRAEGSLYSEPHDVRFDFEATSDGAEWIDDLARAALLRLEAERSLAVGHLDFRVENLGFAGDEVIAIYDWDSLGLASEAVIVGNAAASFSTDWRVGRGTLPEPAEMAAFVADYEEARGAAFTPAERDLLDAANLYHFTYSARCEHSDYMRLGLQGEGPLASLLRERGASYLS